MREPSQVDGDIFTYYKMYPYSRLTTMTIMPKAQSLASVIASLDGNEVGEAVLRRLRGAVELRHFSTVRMGVAFSSSAFLTDYPADWQEHYVQQRRDQVDPVMRRANEIRLPISWSRLPSPHAGAFFGEAQEFGLARHGMAIPLQGGRCLFSLNVEIGGQDWQRLEPLLAADLFLLAHILHEKGLRPPASAPPLSGLLGPRKREALVWAAQGKSSWETGAILGLSAKTVDHYIANACGKLQAANRTHAVAICLSRGLFDMPMHAGRTG
ncbi:DNA-binding transcriptional regulator, CsgD family [Paracoccus pantotrophus]|nr:DNA-binding transcriptional regulator, CsgD family [Paracoccus pantotrophus]